MAPTPAAGVKARLGIVAPVLDEAATLAPWLDALQPLRRRGVALVIVDGGSRDATADIARARADVVLEAPRGRAAQMNAGAAAAHADALLFLHADTRLPEGADALVLEALARGRGWGRFDVRIDTRRPLLRLVARAMNARSRLTGIATGDQALFVRRDLFDAVGGFPEIPLMEDIALSRALKRHGRPACLRAAVVTSARRWERHGAWTTILLMWRLRAAYFLAAVPARLALRYGAGRRES
jgi:rSAM/selenodomain-associated transferase 2